jgi:hypothetical protein
MRFLLDRTLTGRRRPVSMTSTAARCLVMAMAIAVGSMQTVYAEPPKGGAIRVQTSDMDPVAGFFLRWYFRVLTKGETGSTVGSLPERIRPELKRQIELLSKAQGIQSKWAWSPQRTMLARLNQFLAKRARERPRPYTWNEANVRARGTQVAISTSDPFSTLAALSSYS